MLKHRQHPNHLRGELTRGIQKHSLIDMHADCARADWTHSLLFETSHYAWGKLYFVKDNSVLCWFIDRITPRLLYRLSSTLLSFAAGMASRCLQCTPAMLRSTSTTLAHGSWASQRRQGTASGPLLKCAFVICTSFAQSGNNSSLTIISFPRDINYL